MKKGTSNKDVIAALRLKTKELLKDNERYERLVIENKDVIDSLNKSIVALGGSSFNEVGNSISKGGVGGNTFKDNVLKVFEDGKPRTSRQLYNDFLKVVGETKIKDFYDFSGRFANITKKAGISKHKIPENPINIRFFYGKSDWFDGDRLKANYLSKINYD